MELGCGCCISSLGTHPGMPMPSTPPPAAWHHCDSAGMSVPLQGSESPPPPPEGCCLSPGPPVLPKGGDANPDAFLEEGCACAPPGAGPSSPSPLLKGLPPPPPLPIFLGHPVLMAFHGTTAGGGEPVCRTRRSCAVEAPALPSAQRLAEKGCGCLHRRGGPPVSAGSCRTAPRFAFPTGTASTACEVWGASASSPCS